MSYTFERFVVCDGPYDTLKFFVLGNLHRALGMIAFAGKHAYESLWKGCVPSELVRHFSGAPPFQWLLSIHLPYMMRSSALSTRHVSMYHVAEDEL